MGKAMFEKEKVCFSFRLIDMGNGSQVIDESIKTPMDALTPELQAEYMEVHEQLAFMKMIQKNDRRETERGRKLERNPLHRLACFCGLA